MCRTQKFIKKFIKLRMLSLIFLCGFMMSLHHPSLAEEEGFVAFKILTPETALTMAQAALENCREGGYQIAVSVVDRFGVEQVFLRDRFAGLHTNETAFRKAWTAVSFRTNTSEMGALTMGDQALSGLRFISNVATVGGGVPVLSAGELVAGIGISGAPGGDLDEACAMAGIEAIQDILDF